jgi:ribonuclease P protein component
LAPSAASLPRSARLRSPREFQDVFKSGKRVQQSPLAAAFRRNEEPRARLGLAIGRRFAPRAVDRNRAKRQIRESFRHSSEGLPSVDLVVFPRASLADVDNSTLRRAADALWRKVTEQCLKCSSPPSASTKDS